MLIAILLWPAWSPISVIVGFPTVAAATSFMVPVLVPAASWATAGKATVINKMSIKGIKIFKNPLFEKRTFLVKSDSLIVKVLSCFS